MTNKRPHMDDEGLERQREALREALRLCNRQIAERGDASPALNQPQASPAPPPAIMPTPPASAPAANAATIAAATPLNNLPHNAVQTPAVTAPTYAATPLINQPSNTVQTPVAAAPAYPAPVANQASALSASTAPTSHRAITPRFEAPDTASALANIANNMATNRPAAVPAPRASFAQLPAQPLFQDPPPRPETPPAYEEYTYRGRARGRGRGRGRAEGGRAGCIYTIFVCRAHDQIYCQQCCSYVASDVYWARHPELTEQ